MCTLNKTDLGRHADLTRAAINPTKTKYTKIYKRTLNSDVKET